MAAIRYETPAGEQIRAFSTGLTIGRDAANDLPLANQPPVSRRHARISGSPEEGYVLEDLGSRNGTALERDGSMQPVETSVRLAHGDIILIGSMRLLFDGTTAAEPDGPQTLAAEEAAAFSPGETVIGGFPSPSVLAGEYEEAEPVPPPPPPAVRSVPQRSGLNPGLVAAAVVVVVVVVAVVVVVLRS